MSVLTKHPHAAAALEQAAWLRYRSIEGCATSTLMHLRRSTDRLLVAKPSTPFADFTDEHLLDILVAAPPASVSRWASPFKSWFGWGVRTRRIVVNPTDFLPHFREPRAKVVPHFTVEEEAALRALPEPHGTLMALLFDAGLRKGEAIGLTGKRIDFAAEQIIVIDGAKGGKQRLVPICADVAPGLLGRLDQHLTVNAIGPDDHLWPIRPGGGSRIKYDRPITAPSWHKWWGRCIGAAGIRYLKPHTSRHTYARRWRKRGLHMEDIQIVLGHEDPRVTQRYAQTEIEDVTERMAAARKESRV